MPNVEDPDLPLIALFCIVKDEEAALPRMLESAEGLCDVVVAINTGSQDATVDVLKRHGATVLNRPWVNFGHNLTEAVRAAKGSARWLLRVDADQTLSWHPGLRRWLSESAASDAYNVTMQEGVVEWKLPRLLRGDLNWTFVGPTHEYLDAEGRSTRDLLGLTIRHHADGSNRTGKFERDLDLLADGVLKGDPRSTFYTAECYRFMGDLDMAIHFYDKRAAMDGTWEEEAWYAEYQAASCAATLDRNDAMERLMLAHQRRPSRAEPLDAMRTHIENRWPKSPPDDSLFVVRSLYG